MVNAMEWQKQQRWLPNGNNGDMMCVKVAAMTDEQLETLRKQIAVYATLCEQLVEKYNTHTTHQDLAGVGLGNKYCDPLMASGGYKITSRQRWMPTPVQLQILECMFDQGTGTPSKEKIKEITAELSQHGQISETNVYNWFQNRRARSKRKPQNVAPSNTESEVETEVDFKDKKTRPEEFKPQQSITTAADNLCFQSPAEVCFNLPYMNPESNKPDSMFASDGSLRSTKNFSHVAGLDGTLSNSRSDYLAGKREAHGNGNVSYNLYQQAGNHNMEVDIH